MAEEKKISFKRVPASEKNVEKILRPPTTFLKDAMWRFSRNKLGVLGLAIIVFMALFAIFGPMLRPYKFDAVDLMSQYQRPNAQHWFGTDMHGRDQFVRVAYGARVSLCVGIVCAVVSCAIGIVYGTISGYAGGVVDTLMQRVLEVIDSVPSTLYLILLMVVFDRSMTNVLIVIALTSWVGMARLVRGEVLSLKSREYVLAAKVSNVSTPKLMLRHLVPNAAAPIMVSLTLGIPGAIFSEAYLQFIGLGPVDVPSWGALCSDALDLMTRYPYLLVFPSLFISVTILAFNFIGDALRDALDPKM